MLYIIYVFLISMVPVIELRGAIPLGFSWGVETWVCFVAAVLGNILPVPFILLFGEKVLRWFAKFEKFGKPFRWIIARGERKADKLNSSKSLFWGLFAFVAIPLPGTGAWTGSLAAMLLHLDYKKSLPPIICGVLAAGVFVTLVVYGAVELPDIFRRIFSI